MRGRIGSLLTVLLAFCVGCGETQTARRETATRREPVAPTGGVSMYPLTSPTPAPPMRGYAVNPVSPDALTGAPAYTPPPSPYGQLAASPVYYGGRNYQVVDTTRASAVVPITDPPIVMENAYYAPAVSPTPPTAPILPPPTPAYSDARVYSTPNFGVTSPAYTSSSGQYCEVTDTSESSYMVPMADPPIVVNGQPSAYYAPSAPVPVPMYAPVTPISSPAPYTYPVTTTVPVSFPPMPPAVDELRLVPARDIPPGNHPNDYGPSQWFEILRPGNGPIRIGRVSSTCVCVGVRVPNRHVAAGERALVEARIVARPPQNNLTYGVYVQVLEPVSMTLDADVTVSARR